MSTPSLTDTCPIDEEITSNIPPQEIEMGGTTLATVIDQIERLRALFESKFPNLSIKLKTAGKYFSVLSSFLHKAQENISKYAPKITSIAKKIIDIAAQFAYDNPVLAVAILTMMTTLITEIRFIVSNSRQSTTIGNQKNKILQLQKQIQELEQARDEAIACANTLGNKLDDALKNSAHPQNASQASSITNNQTSTTNNPSVNTKNTPNRIDSTTINTDKGLNNAQARTGVIARFCDFIAEFMEDIVFKAEA